jgi:hypothetical protein
MRSETKVSDSLAGEESECSSTSRLNINTTLPASAAAPPPPTNQDEQIKIKRSESNDPGKRDKICRYFVRS